MSGPRRPRRRAVRAVSLDAAGTLLRVAEPVGETYAAHARRFGGEASAAAIGEGFRRAFPAMEPLAFPGARPGDVPALERTWWRELVGRVFTQCGVRCDFEPCFDALWAHYADAGAWRLFPEVPGVLERLAARGTRLVVVSNFDSRLHGLLAGLGVRDALEAVICSGAAGAAKPDAAIFTAAAAALDLDPGDILHVGDGPDADYRGARGAGLHALLLDRGAGSAPPAIASLRGVLDWLDARA